MGRGLLFGAHSGAQSWAGRADYRRRFKALGFALPLRHTPIRPPESPTATHFSVGNSRRWPLGHFVHSHRFCPFWWPLGAHFGAQSPWALQPGGGLSPGRPICRARALLSRRANTKPALPKIWSLFQSLHGRLDNIHLMLKALESITGVTR